MNETFLILAAALLLTYGLFSAIAEKSILTPHMVFMLAGVLFSPLGLGLVELKPDTPAVVLLAKVALVIILAADASQADKKVLKKTSGLPVRLLFIGLPLTIVAGAGFTLLVKNESVRKRPRISVRVKGPSCLTQPDGDPDGAGRPVPGWLQARLADPALHGLVRPPRHRIDPLPADAGRRSRCRRI